MANKEVRVKHKDIENPSTITQVVEQAFKDQAGCDAHKNDCVDLVDDFSRGERIYKLKKQKFFGPWSHRG